MVIFVNFGYTIDKLSYHLTLKFKHLQLVWLAELIAGY